MVCLCVFVGHKRELAYLTKRLNRSRPVWVVNTCGSINRVFGGNMLVIGVNLCYLMVISAAFRDYN